MFPLQIQPIFLLCPNISGPEWFYCPLVVLYTNPIKSHLPHTVNFVGIIIGPHFLVWKIKGSTVDEAELKHRMRRIHPGNFASLIKTGLDVYSQILKSIINLNMKLNYQGKALIGLCCSIFGLLFVFTPWQEDFLSRWSHWGINRTAPQLQS